MKVKITFYKDTGKWYEDCIVEVPTDFLFKSHSRYALYLYQTAVTNPEQFIMIAEDINDDDPFFRRLYHPVEVDINEKRR